MENKNIDIINDKRTRQRVLPAVFILVIVFSSSAWIDFDGLVVELPVLVNRLPEGWKLPSYFFIIIAISNVGPIIYTICKKIWADRLKEWYVMYVIMGVGSLCLFILAFVWDRTSVLAGEEHSTAMLTVLGVLCVMDSTSSVVFLPYMDNFKSKYMSAFFAGDGVGQLLPIAVSMIQGVGETPVCVNVTHVMFNQTSGLNETAYRTVPEYAPLSFSVRGYILCISALMITAPIAFSLLNFLPYCKNERISKESIQQRDNLELTEEKHQESLTDYKDRATTKSKDTTPSFGSHEPQDVLDPLVNFTYPDQEVRVNTFLKSAEFYYLLFIVGWVYAMLYGIIPAIQSYASIPYGNRAYTLTVRLGLACNTLFSIVALFLSTYSLVVLGVLTVLGTTGGGYQVYLAAMSPHPPLKGTPAGETLVILSYMMMFSLLAYVRVLHMEIIKNKGGSRALLWAGWAMQIGMILGSTTGFVTVNVFALFHSESICDGQ